MEITEVNKKIVQRFYELVEQENYAEAKKKEITHKILVPTKDGGYVNFNDLSEEQKQHIRNQCFTRFADSYMGQLGYTRVHTEDEAVSQN